MSLTQFAALACFLAIVAAVFAESCQKPQVTPKIYTTTDGTVVTNIGFIAEFTVACANNLKNMNLYADINGKQFVATKAANGNKYQVSWTSEQKEIRAWSYPIKIYDEDGYAALRKAQRSGDDPTSISPLFTFDVDVPGIYNGPWFQSEFVALLVASLVFYFAYSTKSKLLA